MRIQRLCVALAAVLLLPASEVCAKDTKDPEPHPVASGKHTGSTRKPSAPAHALPTHIQTTRLRYTGLSSLPARARSEFHAPLLSPTIEATEDAEARCAHTASAADKGPGDAVPPCLGLYYGSNARSPIKFSFDLALKSVGAPKDIFIGRCPTGNNSNAACSSLIGETRTEQERLADTLDRQHRSPVATLGVAVSF